MDNIERTKLQKELVEKYKTFIQRTDNAGEAYKWLAIDNFQQHWNIDADDFANMFNLAFKKKGNLFYQNSWGFITKAVKKYPEKVRGMFKDLYNEPKNLKERIDSFQLSAKELLPALKNELETDKLNDQQDERVISVYLALMFPEKHYLYMYSFYDAYCRLIGEVVTYPGERYIHYRKLADQFKNEIVLKDTKLLKIHKQLNPKNKWDDINLVVQNILFSMLDPIQKEKSFIIANITWNSNDWKEPSHDKSGHKWVTKGGQPHESWNFDFDNPRNKEDKLLGFCQFTNPPIVTGTENLIIFYSTNKIVGFYGATEVLKVPISINNHESYNLIGSKKLSVYLPQKIDNVKEKGYLEGKARVGMIGFNYLKKLDTIIKILDEAIALNPDQVPKLEAIKEWVNKGGDDEKFHNLHWENSLIDKIRIIADRNKVEQFLDLLALAVDKFDLENDNPRISFSTPKSPTSYISATIGQRYIISLENKTAETPAGFELAFIAARKYEEVFKNGKGFKKLGDFSSTSTKSEPPHYAYYDETALPVDEDLIHAWLSTIKTELNRVEISSHRQYHNPLYYKAVVDAEYRKYILDKIFNSENHMNDQALNQILYGPPGTGKTYHTINEAIKIVDPEFYGKFKDDRIKLRERFNQLKINDWKNPQKGQISFCTFHQSFSYEDFIEGIKPVVKGDDSQDTDGELKYRIEDGIFKLIANRARHFASGAAQKDKQRIQLSEAEYAKAQFYKISLGDINVSEDKAIYDYCIENGCIAIGFMESLDLTGFDETKIYSLSEEKKLGRFEGQAMTYFMQYLKIGNYIVVSKGNRKVRAIGKVTGDYFYEKDPAIQYNHFRNVEWIIKDADIPVEEVYEKAFSQQSIYKLNSDWINKEFFVHQPASIIPEEVPKFVLIIDEINRGNISQIFGELITLIEPDKRAGNKESLDVTLPYSKTEFSIPSNLYLIGTMNTADRSIEALDTALRRRFTFVEIAPDPVLIKEKGLSKGEIEGINLVKMLETINNRIEKLLDKDHMIGHSYFLDISDISGLKEAFRNKIIPLLEEYFYGDYGKIGLVLGDTFVSNKYETKKDFDFAQFKGYEKYIVEDLENKKVYSISASKNWTADTFTAIY